VQAGGQDVSNLGLSTLVPGEVHQRPEMAKWHTPLWQFQWRKYPPMYFNGENMRK